MSADSPQPIVVPVDTGTQQYDIHIGAGLIGCEFANDLAAGGYGVDIIEPIRVETGMVVTDYDYEPHRRTPYDLGLDRLVALDGEGTFMGKEELRSVAADPPNRFVTIRLEGETLPEYGAAVTAGGEDAGVLTSPAISPRLGALGLAILRTEMAAPGTGVEVAMSGGASIGGTVDVLAVYDPQKERPRA